MKTAKANVEFITPKGPERKYRTNDANVTDITPEKPSKRAFKEAEKRNKKEISNALRKAEPMTVLSFIMNNKDAYRRIDWLQLNTISEQLSQEKSTKAAKNKAKAELMKVASTIIKNTKINKLDIRNIDTKLTTPRDIQQEQFVTEKRKASAKPHFLKAENKTQYVVKSVASLGILPLTQISAHILDGTMAYFDISEKTRNKYEMAALTAAFFAVKAPISAEHFVDTFQQQATASENMMEVYNQHPQVADYGQEVAAWAATFYEHDNPAKVVAFQAYLAALEKGANPIVATIISLKETGFLRDVDARSSKNKYNTASGLFQTTLDTKLDWLKRNHKEIDYKGDTNAKFVVEHLVAEYTKNPNDTKKALRSNTVAPHFQTALHIADRPEIIGQLFALEALRMTPEMSLAYLQEHGLAATKFLTGKHYQPHLIGAYGAPFLSYVAAIAPNTKMRDAAALNAIHAKYKNRVEKFNAGGYYSKVMKENPGVFKKGENPTATQYVQKIANFSMSGTNGFLSDIAENMKKGDTALEILSKNPETLRNSVPETTTLAEVACIEMNIENLCTTVSAKFDQAITAGVALYNAQQDASETKDMEVSVETPAENIIPIPVARWSDNDNETSAKNIPIPVPRWTDIDDKTHSIEGIIKEHTPG